MASFPLGKLGVDEFDEDSENFRSIVECCCVVLGLVKSAGEHLQENVTGNAKKTLVHLELLSADDECEVLESVISE